MYSAATVGTAASSGCSSDGASTTGIDADFPFAATRAITDSRYET